MALMDKAEDVVIVAGVAIAGWWAWNNTNIFDGIKNMFGQKTGSGGSQSDQNKDQIPNTNNSFIDWFNEWYLGGAAKTGTDTAEKIKERVPEVINTANRAGTTINSWLFPTYPVNIPKNTGVQSYGAMPSLYGSFAGNTNAHPATQPTEPENIQRAVAASANASIGSMHILPAATGVGLVGLTPSTQPSTVMNATGNQPLFVPMGVDTQSLNKISTVYMNTNTGTAYHLGGR